MTRPLKWLFKRLLCFSVLLIQIMAVTSTFAGVSKEPTPDGVVAIYIVDENSRTLGEIAHALYGRASIWERIAQWNNLSAPYRLRVGQSLILKEPIRQSEEQAHKSLLGMWRRRFDLPNDISIPVILSEDEMTSEQLLDYGSQSLKDGQAEVAISRFKKSREKDPKLLPAWLKELSTLNNVGKTEEMSRTLNMFLGIHPEMKDLPFIKSLNKRNNEHPLTGIDR